MSKPIICAIIAGLILSEIFISCSESDSVIKRSYPDQTMSISSEKAIALSAQIREEVAVTMPEGLELSLWASDSIVNDPIAISFDPYGGMYYTQGNRIEHSEFDIRGHRDWMTTSISWQTVEDRRAFIRSTFTDDSEQAKEHLTDLNKDGVLNWKDLTVEKEEVWRVFDENKDGFADNAKLYLADFHEEISDLANGVEYFDGDVYISVGPDLWKTTDIDADGIAEQLESLAHGFAVHIGFGAHGMSGVVAGPDGRIWWGIGDIGMNLVDKAGKRWKYPNRGVIVRCEPDGSNFEVWSMGHRNTHEFTFDHYGNLISVDNDGDHAGERERLVYIPNGSDSGWRINWQFGKYTDPDNNEYKVWMDEKLHVPRWEGQAAYIIPPIVNYVNGPTGMVYNPGTALGEAWYNHFFIAEFRGTPANSPIHAFTLVPAGAGFELDKSVEFIRGLLPTGIDFGPDGALYFADWIDGWGAKHLGRIWKIDVPGGNRSAIRMETQRLIELDFSKLEISQLKTHLAHQDMRVRQKAQFELAKRDEEGYQALRDIATNSQNQLARIHGLWGMGQVTRRNPAKGQDFEAFLIDTDQEIVAQAAKQIGDFNWDGAGRQLADLVNHENPRIRFFATEALGRSGEDSGIDAIEKMLIENNDTDVYLRHAGSLALARIGNDQRLASLATHSSRALRIAAVVALRRMESPMLSKFLNDTDEYIVTEAARAINDDWSVEESLPDLAKLIEQDRFSAEPLMRRIINANLRVGKAENLKKLMDYAQAPSAPPAMRAEALAAALTWAKPSLHDRVDGRYRGVINRDLGPVKDIFTQRLPELLNDSEGEIAMVAVKSVSQLNITSLGEQLFEMFKKHKSAEVRSQIISSIAEMEYSGLAELLKLGLADESNSVRTVSLEKIPESGLNETDAVKLLSSVLKDGTTEEQQAAIASFAKFQGAESTAALDSLLGILATGSMKQELRLDIVEAIEIQGQNALGEKLKQYLESISDGTEYSEYRDALFGGNISNGRRIFFRHEGAQCVRCHSIFEWGGDAGPGLQGLASRMTAEGILANLINPSASIAERFGVVSLQLQNGETVAGVVLSESETSIDLRIGLDERKNILKSDIDERSDLPSSMPSVKNILTKREIRDLMAFMNSLHETET